MDFAPNQVTEVNGWSVVYEKAIRDDGSLLFPQRLSKEFLESQRKVMGSFLFSNQYQNIIIPDDEKKFKSSWLKRYSQIPENVHTFAFIDPAIGQRNHHDYTGICVVHADSDGVWYLRVAKRERLTPTQIVEQMFNIQEQFKCKAIGVEIVAYQEALLYMLDQEMKKRQKIIPVKAVRRNNVSKETRILALVPRFEWSRIFVNHGLTDFEDEFNTFPRGKFDDLLDALSSLEELVFYPQKEKKELKQPNSPNHPDYERWVIQQMVKKANQGG